NAAPIDQQVLRWDGSASAWTPMTMGNGTGTVTGVNAGAGLSGGPITTSGTLSIAAGGVTNAMLANPSLTVVAGSGMSGRGAGVWAVGTLAAGDLPSLSGSYVDLGSAQSIGGTKSFTSTVNADISGNAATVTNGVYTTGSYPNPFWITSLDGSKISGSVSSA